MKDNKKTPYPVKILTHGARLPQYISFFENKVNQHDQILADTASQIEALKSDLKEANRTLAQYRKLDDRITDINHRLNISSANDSKVSTSANVINSTVADNHEFDQFYKAFEDKFRGSEEVIKKRLLEHIPLFNKLPKAMQSKPIVDIGCGRGELLEVLKTNGFHSIGIDMNESMIQRAIDEGYEAYNTDALSYLSTLKKNSLAAVTGFHIVEHIPFESLMAIFTECYRVVGSGGFVLFETPNPETFTVGSHTFHLDPSHLKPVPPQLLAFMLEYVGFESEILRIHEVDQLPASVKSRFIRKLYGAAFGPADYAVIARKL